MAPPTWEMDIIFGPKKVDDLFLLINSFWEGNFQKRSKRNFRNFGQNSGRITFWPPPNFQSWLRHCSIIVRLVN